MTTEQSFPNIYLLFIYISSPNFELDSEGVCFKSDASFSKQLPYLPMLNYKTQPTEQAEIRTGTGLTYLVTQMEETY